MEPDDVIWGHLWRPSRRREDKAVGSPGILCVNTELNRLFRRLCPGSCNDEGILKPIFIEGLSCQRDGLLAFLVRARNARPLETKSKQMLKVLQMLGFSI